MKRLHVEVLGVPSTGADRRQQRMGVPDAPRPGQGGLLRAGGEVPGPGGGVRELGGLRGGGAGPRGRGERAPLPAAAVRLPRAGGGEAICAVVALQTEAALFAALHQGHPPPPRSHDSLKCIWLFIVFT